jgi:hypothetical protein
LCTIDFEKQRLAAAGEHIKRSRKDIANRNQRSPTRALGG